MPATPFDTSGKSGAFIQGADYLRRAAIRFTSPNLLRVKGVGGGPFWCAFRTQVRHRVTSEKCHEETHAPQQITALFNHLVGAGEECRRHNDIKRLCSLQIDHQFVLGRLFDRQVGWLRSLDNLVDEARSTPI
jgi:hypothetical protein